MSRRMHTAPGAALANEGRSRPRAAKPGTVAQADTLSPNGIIEIAYGFWQSKALFAAVELDVFTVLAGGPLDLDTLAMRIGIHRRGARDFFDALVGLGFIARVANGAYANAPESDTYLVRGRPTFIGGLLKHLEARHYHHWNFLTRALVTGEPQSALGTASYHGLYADEAAQEIFLAGMTAGSLLAARALAQTFPWQRYETFVDIGTAQGCVPVEIARVHPHLRGGGFDLETVAPVFESYVRENGLSDRLTFYPGNFFADPLPPADVLVMGRILHNWGIAARTSLLDKAYQAIAPGGALIVYDPLVDDGRQRPHGLLSSLNMLIETAEGSEYSAAQCAGWMTQAGFRDIEVEPLPDVHTALIGFKPG